MGYFVVGYPVEGPSREGYLSVFCPECDRSVSVIFGFRGVWGVADGLRVASNMFWSHNMRRGRRLKCVTAYNTGCSKELNGGKREISKGWRPQL